MDEDAAVEMTVDLADKRGWVLLPSCRLCLFARSLLCTDCLGKGHEALETLASPFGMQGGPDFEALARAAEDGASRAQSKVIARCWTELAMGYRKLAASRSASGDAGGRFAPRYRS